MFLRIFAFGAILAVGAGQAGATEPDPERGAALYRSHCATCHGLSGVGDGPMTSILTVTPPDLTGLSAGEDFPTADVVRKIDGRTFMLAHGGVMPVFGFILEGPAGVVDDVDGSPLMTTQSVVDIAAWIETIQR